MKLEFTKMHGLGNDFMVIDNTEGRIDFNRDLAGERIKRLADRNFGVGFDQMLVVAGASRADAEFDYRIYNADGAEVEHCGNGARCFALFVREKQLTDSKVIPVNTSAGMISLELVGDNQVKVLMGMPKFLPAEIPLLPEPAEPEPAANSPTISAQYAVTLNAEAPAISPEERGILGIAPGSDLLTFSALAIGNPHIVIRVTDVEKAPVNTLGPWLENHNMFPNRVNVGFLQVIDADSVRLRVFERGVGETSACGTGACAAAVASYLQGWTNSQVVAHLNGGNLTVNWPGSSQNPAQNVEMTGPCTKVFEGYIEL